MRNNDKRQRHWCNNRHINIYPISYWTRIYPAFANSVDPDQLAFAIKYMNLKQQSLIKQSDWLKIRNELGILISIAWQGLKTATALERSAKATTSGLGLFFFFFFFFFISIEALPIFLMTPLKITMKQSRWLNNTLKPSSEVIQHYSCSTQLSMKFSLLINMKMPTVVGIFIFISRENFHAQLYFARTNLQLLVSNLRFISRTNFMHRWAWTKFYNLGAWAKENQLGPEEKRF